MKDAIITIEAKPEFILFLSELFVPIKNRVKEHRSKSSDFIPEDLIIGRQELKDMYSNLNLNDIKSFLQAHSSSASAEALELLDTLCWIKEHDKKSENGVVNCGDVGIRVYENRVINSIGIRFKQDGNTSELTVNDNSDSMLYFDSRPNQNGNKSLKGGTITTKTGQRLTISTTLEPAKNMLGPTHGIEITDNNNGKVVAVWEGSFNESDSRSSILWPKALMDIQTPKREFTIGYTGDSLHSEKLEVSYNQDPRIKKGTINPSYGKGSGVSDFFGVVRGQKVIGISASTTSHDTAPGVSAILTITEHDGPSITRKNVLLTKAKSVAFVDPTNKKNIDKVINLIAGPLHESIDSR